jgi:N-acetylglutamate synthase
MTESALALDLICARAWPPVEMIETGGWKLRFSEGVTQRANSVLACPPAHAGGVPSDLDERVAAVEDAYAERGLPARFQITPSAWPAGLGDTLRRRGYIEADRTLIMTLDLAAAPRMSEPTGGKVLIAPAEPSSEWIETWWSVDGRGRDRELGVARRILENIEPARHFIEMQVGDATASVGLAVIDSGWVGVYCMATRPAFRRRGFASLVLAHALALGARHTASHAYLAVSEANKSALWLYAKAGFKARQAYSYFTRPIVGEAPSGSADR